MKSRTDTNLCRLVQFTSLDVVTFVPQCLNELDETQPVDQLHVVREVQVRWYGPIHYVCTAWRPARCLSHLLVPPCYRDTCHSTWPVEETVLLSVATVSPELLLHVSRTLPTPVPGRLSWPGHLSHVCDYIRSYFMYVNCVLYLMNCWNDSEWGKNCIWNILHHFNRKLDRTKPENQRSSWET